MCYQVGTLLYIAPEIVRGDCYDERCDIYSFAVVLLAMLQLKDDVVTVFAEEVGAAILERHLVNPGDLHRYYATLGGVGYSQVLFWKLCSIRRCWFEFDDTRGLMCVTRRWRARELNTRPSASLLLPLLEDRMEK